MAFARERKQKEDDGMVDRLVDIRRVAKTVKGGRNMRFAALVVVGDQKGRVGVGTGKSREVPEAIRKANESAKRNIIRVPLRNGKTLHHDIIGHFGAAKVVMRAAVPGTGIIAGGPMRAVFECLGIQDVVAKSIGTSNPNNMIKATFEAFEAFESPRLVASRRGRKVSDIVLKTKEAEEREEAPAPQKTEKKTAPKAALKKETAPAKAKTSEKKAPPAKAAPVKAAQKDEKGKESKDDKK